MEGGDGEYGNKEEDERGSEESSCERGGGGRERGRTLPGDMTSEIKDGEKKEGEEKVIERSAVSFWRALLALHFSLCFVGRD